MNAKSTRGRGLSVESKDSLGPFGIEPGESKDSLYSESWNQNESPKFPIESKELGDHDSHVGLSIGMDWEHEGAGQAEAKYMYSGIKFSTGSYVERVIDGMWFVARIEKIDERKQEVRLCYVDDHNIEDKVPFGEIRPTRPNSGQGPPVQISNCSQVTLAKPLAGLIEDDAEQRLAHRPTVVIHSCADSEEAIILNGAENRLAAGGGLRALRHLRKLKGDEEK